MYIIKNEKIDNQYIGVDNSGSITTVRKLNKALKFETYVKAENYRKNMKKTLRKMAWVVDKIIVEECQEVKESTINENIKENNIVSELEKNDFDIEKYIENTILLFSQLEIFSRNMKNQEQEKNNIISDITHYLRDERTKLNAIQMQRLGYYLQLVLRERWQCKKKRLIAEDVLLNIERMTDKKYIDEIKSQYSSEYKPRVLEFSIIDSLIGRSVKNVSI